MLPDVSVGREAMGHKIHEVADEFIYKSRVEAKKTVFVGCGAANVLFPPSQLASSCARHAVQEMVASVAHELRKDHSSSFALLERRIERG